MIVLGLDPGVATIGYSFLDINERNFELLQCGVISTSANQLPWERLKIIREDISELITNFKPEVAAIELVYFAKNVKTAMKVAQARGVIVEAVHSAGVDKIIEMTPTHVKQVLFGHGRAVKKEIQMVVAQALGMKELIKPDDAADATALALAYMRSQY
ncbi:MAG TPA: crossover junction endodeoxyribonuclease RuvC [Vampirovibrionales bacterium]